MLPLETLDIESLRESLFRSLKRIEPDDLRQPAVECGPQLYRALTTIILAECSIDDAAMVEERLLQGKSEPRFCGHRVVLCHDVPDGRFWPSREISPKATQRRLESDGIEPKAEAPTHTY